MRVPAGHGEPVGPHGEALLALALVRAVRHVGPEVAAQVRGLLRAQLADQVTQRRRRQRAQLRLHHGMQMLARAGTDRGPCACATRVRGGTRNCEH